MTTQRSRPTTNIYGEAALALDRLPSCNVEDLTDQELRTLGQAVAYMRQAMHPSVDDVWIGLNDAARAWNKHNQP